MEEDQGLKEKIERKKAAQHRAWAKWYHSPRGAAYRQKVKERRALAVQRGEPVAK